MRKQNYQIFPNQGIFVRDIPPHPCGTRGRDSSREFRTTGAPRDRQYSFFGRDSEN